MVSLSDPHIRTIYDALAAAEAALTRASRSPRLDAELLLGRVLAKPRSYLYAYPERELDEFKHDEFLGLIERRRRGVPIAYLLESCEFWELELEITPAVLVPRPETEHLVEAALNVLPRHGHLLDLGTGSGAIALAIANSRPDTRVTAIDNSQAALAVARRNRARLGLNRVTIELGDWDSATSGCYAVIASNPPYVEEGAAEWATGSLQWEPRAALDGGTDGLAEIRKIAWIAPHALAPDGWLILEHGAKQGAQVRSIMKDAWLNDIVTLKDLAGLERITLGRQQQ